jgi:hypothetical protein
MTAIDVGGAGKCAEMKEDYVGMQKKKLFLMTNGSAV